MAHWTKETDKQLLERWRRRDVIGIFGFDYWAKIDQLEKECKKRNLL